MLNIRPRLYPHESVQSYAQRCLHANGYRSIYRLLPGLGAIAPKRGQFNETARLVPSLSCWTGVPEKDLLEVSWRTTSRNNAEHGDLEYRKSWAFPGAQLCPYCLGHNGFSPVEWDFRSFNACPDHGTEMLRFCHDCGLGFSWTREKINKCECGALITAFPAQKADHCDLQFSALIRALLHNPKRISRGGQNLPTIIELKNFLENWLKYMQPEKNNILIAKQFVIDWPHSFHSFLENQFRLIRRRGNTSTITIALPGLLSRLSTDGDKSARLAVSEEVKAYLKSQSPEFITKRGASRLLPEREGGRKSLTLEEASTLVRSSPVKLKKLIKKGLLAADVICDGHTHKYILDSEEVIRVIASDRIERSKNKKGQRHASLCLYLGVSKDTLYTLLKKKIISNTALFQTQKEMRLSIDAIVPTDEADANLEWVPLRQAVYGTLRKKGYTIADSLQLVRDGVLKSCINNASDGFDRIEVSRDSIRAVADRRTV